MNFAKFLRTRSGYSVKNFNVILVLLYIISIIFSIIISIYSIIFYLIIQSTHKLDKKNKSMQAWSYNIKL